MSARTLSVVVVGLLAACNGGAEKPSAKPVEEAKAWPIKGPNPGPTAPVGTPGKQVKFAVFESARSRDAGAPLSLTAGDGTALELTRLDARAVVDGPLAFTELRLTFHNPQPRLIEGQFAITLPQGAAVSRFSMKIAGTWMEAEMVEKKAARRAYEDFLHRRQDPALLEKAAGNEFNARVFPIDANGDKELIISYSQELTDPDAPFVIPLRGLPKIADFSAKVQVARLDGAALYWDEATMAEKAWLPDRDLAMPGSGGVHALGGPGVVAIRVAPEIPSARDSLGRATILVDTSASRAAGFVGYAHAVDQMVDELGRANPGLEVTVAAFDQVVEQIYAGPASGAVGKIDAAMVARSPMGASRLDAALTWAKEHGASGRVIVVTDGVATAGELDTAKLGEVVRSLGSGVERLDVVLAGGIRDRAVAESMTRGKLTRDGAVLDLDAGAEQVANRLGKATRSGIAVKVVGAQWTWPAVLDGMQPGDAAMIYAGFEDTASTPERVNVDLGGDTRTIKVEPASGAMVTRAVVSAEIASMEAQLGNVTDATQRGAQIDRIIELSTIYRVLSSYTSMLVLETEDDYRRFNIDRTALAGILVVGDLGVEVVTRDKAVYMASEDDPLEKTTREKAIEEAKTTGVLGGANGNQGEFATLTGTGDVSSGFDDSDTTGALQEPQEESDDESGGTGTAMSLDEGRMGKRDSDRAEGQYKMKKEEESREDMPARDSPRPGSGAGSGSGNSGASSGSAAGAPAIAQPMPEPDPDALPPVRRPPPPPEPPRPEPPPVRVDKEGRPVPLTGRMLSVMDLIDARKADAALIEAMKWRAEALGDVLALVAVGEAYEAKGEMISAARAYGSIIDLFPARADLRRFAGERLDRVAGTAAGVDAIALAVDTYQRAVEQRPDHLSGHHLLAFALLRAGRPADAFAAIEFGLAQTYPGDRFRGGQRILIEDLGLVGAAWLAADPTVKEVVTKRLAAAGSELPTGASTRFVLVWETDANDVDFHIYDAKKNHAFYSQMQLSTGGELYADVTTGYGPECFTIPGTPKAGPYDLSIHYYSRGPMGYGMGKLQVLRHDGKGKLTFEDRPFIVMNDSAFVELGKVK